MPKTENNSGLKSTKMRTILINLCALWLLSPGADLSLSVDINVQLSGSSLTFLTKSGEDRES